MVTQYIMPFLPDRRHAGSWHAVPINARIKTALALMSLGPFMQCAVAPVAAARSRGGAPCTARHLHAASILLASESAYRAYSKESRPFCS